MDNITGKVVTIDDSETVQLLLNEVLNGIFQLEQFRDPVEAMESLRCNEYDCIVLDLMMPKLSGYELLKQFRDFNKETPVLVLTAKQCCDTEIAELFKIGASDFVTKPFLSAELIARLKHHINLKKTREQLLESNTSLQDAISREEKLNEKVVEKTLRLKKSIKKIKLLNRKLKYFASYDKLTGFLNRRAFFSFLENDIKRLKRTNSKLSILMLDLDFFKKINDTYGHLIGDFILIEFSDLIKEHLRDIDLVGRFGGEEFLILLTDCSVEKAVLVGNKIRELIESAVFKKDDFEYRITVSIGAAEYREDEKIDLFIKRADDALYEAKNTGRNKVVSSH